MRFCARSFWMQDISNLGEYVLDHAGCTAPTQQHEVDHADQEIYLPCLADVDHEL